MKENLLNVILVLLIVCGSFACKMLSGGGADNTNISSNNENSNQKSEQVSAPKGLKPPEPCAWFEKSLGIKAEQYKAAYGDAYRCEQEKKLVNSSTFRYKAFGNATLINLLLLEIFIFPQNTEQQKTDMNKMLILAATDVADKASGQKLSDEIISAIQTGESKEFTLAPGADGTKPQIKTVVVAIENVEVSKVVVKHVTFKY